MGINCEGLPEVFYPKKLDEEINYLAYLAYLHLYSTLFLTSDTSMHNNASCQGSVFHAEGQYFILVNVSCEGSVLRFGQCLIFVKVSLQLLFHAKVSVLIWSMFCFRQCFMSRGCGFTLPTSKFDGAEIRENCKNQIYIWHSVKYNIMLHCQSYHTQSCILAEHGVNKH